MKVPITQLSISPTEYFEQGWWYTASFLLLLCAYILITTMGCLSFRRLGKNPLYGLAIPVVGTSPFIIHTLINASTAAFLLYVVPLLWLILLTAGYYFIWVVSWASRFEMYLVSIMMILFGLGLTVGGVRIWGGTTYENGIWKGRSYVTDTPTQIRIVAAEPLMLDAPKIISTTISSDTTYKYEGLRLLTYNNERYFLFSTINAECKPEQVYVVKDEDVQSVQYISAPPLKPDCIPADEGGDQPSPMPTSSPARSTTPTETPLQAP